LRRGLIKGNLSLGGGLMGKGEKIEGSKRAFISGAQAGRKLVEKNGGRGVNEMGSRGVGRQRVKKGCLSFLSL